MNGFQHRAIAVASAAYIVDLAAARFADKMPECIYQVVAVDIVADLFALIAKDGVGTAGDDALD